MFKNPIVSGVLSVCIAAWCAYDLWFAAEPSRGGTRMLDYFLLVMALMGLFGAFMMKAKEKA